MNTSDLNHILNVLSQQELLRYKQQIRTLDVTVNAGSNANNNSITLPKGDIVLACAVPDSSQDKIVNLGFYEQGQEINAPMDLSLWKNKEIGHKWSDGLVLLNTQGNADIEGRIVVPSGNLGTALTVQIVFVILQENTSC